MRQSENTTVVNAVGYTYDAADYVKVARVNPGGAASEQLEVEIEQDNNGKRKWTTFPSTTPRLLEAKTTNAGRPGDMRVGLVGASNGKPTMSGGVIAKWEHDHLLGSGTAAVDTNQLQSVTVSQTGSSAING